MRVRARGIFCLKGANVYGGFGCMMLNLGGFCSVFGFVLKELT